MNILPEPFLARVSEADTGNVFRHRKTVLPLIVPGVGMLGNGPSPGGRRFPAQRATGCDAAQTREAGVWSGGTPGASPRARPPCARLAGGPVTRRHTGEGTGSAELPLPLDQACGADTHLRGGGGDATGEPSGACGVVAPDASCSPLTRARPAPETRTHMLISRTRAARSVPDRPQRLPGRPGLSPQVRVSTKPSPTIL